jgi:hypothetical protein
MIVTQGGRFAGDGFYVLTAGLAHHASNPQEGP